jgi:ABC-type transport system substrate-binding protein
VRSVFPRPGAASHVPAIPSAARAVGLARSRATLGTTGAGILTALLLAGAFPAAAGVRPSWGGELRVALPAAPRVLDPARAREPEDLVAVRALHAPLLELDAAGRLAPGLLAEVPVPEAGGRGFRLRLRSDATFSDGTPITAADVAAALTRTVQPAAASPHAWIALPITGADAVLAGRASALAGIAIASDRELLVSLAFPFPDFPWALAAPPARFGSSRTRRTTAVARSRTRSSSLPRRRAARPRRSSGARPSSPSGPSRRARARGTSRPWSRRTPS